MRNGHDKQRKPEETIEHAVAEAMRQVGWIFPLSPNEVRDAENELDANPVELPQGLSDPYAVLRRPHRPIRIARPTTAHAAEAEKSLTRAARDAGEIDAEVRERMRKDREQAEAKGA